MKLSVIIPVHNGSAELRRCLSALATSTRPADEIWVVDDSSTDDSADVARDFGAQVLSLSGGPQGPAVARNQGAGQASGDALLFFDADVLVHEDTIARIEHLFQTEPEISALFGSYDTQPPARNTVSLYKNLLHHYVHQHSRREAWTFWTGCGAIRRQTFEAVGGFDAAYALPSIEDIELGRRLRGAGHRIWLCPDVQVAHLKRWTLKSMVRTDVFCRAVPWTRLLLRDQGGLPADLNLDWKSRLSAVAAWAAVLFLLMAFRSPLALAAMAAALGTVVACNADLLQFFRRQNGWGFALRALGLHTLYFLYSSSTFAFLAIGHKLARHALLLLLLATLFKGLAWSVIIPPWQASDEPQQFLYGQSVERERTLHPQRQVAVPQEVASLAQAVQFGWLVHQNQHAIDFSNPAVMARHIAAADNAASRRVWAKDEKAPDNLLRQPDFTFYHPPLHFALMGAVQAPLEGASIRWRLGASRWLSVALGLLTVGLTFYIGRELWPRRPDLALLLATLVSFQPMFSFSTATVTNIMLEIALFSACLLVLLRILRAGISPARAVGLGVVVSLGLLTKISFLAVLPLILVVMAQNFVSARRGSGGKPFWWLATLALPPLLSGWWYREALVNLTQGPHANFREQAAAIVAQAPMGLKAWFHESAPLGKYPRVLISYWGNFGWPDTIMPLPLLALLGLLTLAVIGLSLRWLFSLSRQKASISTDEDAPDVRAFVVLGLATLSLIGFYLYLNHRITHFGIRGQYYLAASAGQMAWLLWGVALPFSRHRRPMALWLLGVAMMVLNVFSIFGVILPRYYGSAGWGELLARVALLQPLGLAPLGLLCGLYLACALLLSVVLAHFLFEDNQVSQI